MQKKEASSLLKPIGKVFKKFHLLIFFVFTVACLSFAVITANAILTDENLDSSSPQSNSGNPGLIDKSTLERIQSLKPSTEPSTYAAPQNVRTNPFAE